MKLNYGWFTAIIIVLFTIWCGYRLWNNWRTYKYSDAFTASLVFFVITTLYYRFYNGSFNFVPLVGMVTYVDVLWIFAVLFVLEAIVNKTVRKKPNSKGEKNAILLDSPIETPKEDLFD